MRRVPCRSCRAFLILVCFASLHACAATPHAPVPVVIGNPVVKLTGPWRFHPGDDQAWAGADYDDSGWSSMDLTPPADSFDPSTGGTGFLPGWTARGYPKLAGYAWYRFRVDVRSGSGEAVPPLAIRMPTNVDDAYQVYVNGQFIGEFGRFHSKGVTYFNAQPRAFPFPSNLRSGPVTIAIRMWMDSATPFMAPDAGGMHGVPLLGQAVSIAAMLDKAWDEIDRLNVTQIVRVVLLGIVALLGFVFFWLDRREKAYFWLAMSCTVYLLNTLLVVLGYYVTWTSMVTETIASEILLIPVQFGVWAIFWASWFALPEMRWIHRVVWGMVVLLVVGVAMLRPPFYGTTVPISAATVLQPITELLKLAFGAVIFWIVYRGIRLRGTEGWLALVPISLMPVWLYQNELTTLHLIRLYVVHGIPIGLNSLGIVLMMTAISVLMLRRFVGGLREKQHLEMEMEQARQVQQVLIPESLSTIAGFEIYSEYRPAQQVGGDFFQILPLESGAFLAVIGDVSGKGIPAAMTVSLLVGTVRTALSFTRNPAELLDVLNTRMMGRSQGGFTTCLIVRVDADGTVTAANAGHLAPYLNGHEMAVANGLPLGLSASAGYGETVFRLPLGGRMTMITDGVVEARSKTGELFGFERAAAIAGQTAADIAQAAQQFGQEDDITVLGVRRLAAEPAAAVLLSDLSSAPA